MGRRRNRTYVLVPLVAVIALLLTSFGGDAYARKPVRTPRPTAVPTVLPTPTSAPTVTPTSAYSFQDECSGTSLDPRWSSLLGPGDPGDRLDTDFLGNLSQVSVANGVCTIKVERKSTPSGRPFAGAMYATYGTFGQRYGTWESRLRYDENQGTWPSWFLLPVGQRAPYPEVDVFEAYGDTECLGPGAVVTAVHYQGETVSDYKIVPLSNSSSYHTHKMVWTSSRIDFYIDGVLTYSNTTHVPQVAMYPIFVYGVGANAPGCRADATTPDLLRMDIDYIRVSN